MPAERPELPSELPGDGLTGASLRTPRAAAIAGIAFSVLLLAAFALLRYSIPADPLEPGAWLKADRRPVVVAVNLIPFAGIAFLWFIGVVRDRLGQREDRFFASVFFGSGLLFLGTLFVSAATVGAIITAFASQPDLLINSATFHFARAVAYDLVNVYMIKMAGVFMFSTSTVALFTHFTPRWMAFLGYALSLLVLFGSYYLNWSFAVFPIWVFLVSIYILIDNMRG
jgi:hypothetical protein